MWPIGEQPLLYHWLDYAVDRGYSRVLLICSDRPAEVRSVMEEAHLWPIEWELYPVRSVRDREDYEIVDHLPGLPRPMGEITNGWELLDRWFLLRRAWFDLTMPNDEARRPLALGRFAQIHPTAEIVMPVWFEDHVQIGPGCRVGPT
ncbi:MAG: hypothetical protein HC923_02150 [Myxococcales bacterium]|nr:hypothetical protein [Myxococcales bacterium]